MKLNTTPKRFFSTGAILSCLALINGCDSSSSPDSVTDIISAQAIDGYIVGGTVFCDDSVNGGTAAAGQLVCPAGTRLIRVRGGTDVGFDAEATTGDNPFSGELAAPGTLNYVTPLSTVAVAMSTEAGVFNADLFDESVNSLASALGLSSLDLNADASTTLQVTKLNSQIHQILSGFSPTADDYVRVTQEFAALARLNAESQSTLNLTSGASNTLMALNSRLAASDPDLVLNQIDLDTLSSDTVIINSKIESAAAIDLVAIAATTDVTAGNALSIDRTSTPVYFQRYWGGRYSYTLDHYEQDTLVNGSYIANIDTRYSRISFGSSAFTVSKSLDNANIGIGFEFESTDPGDSRKMSVTTSDAFLSMVEGDSQSMEIKFPSTATFHARSIAKDGTISDAVFEVNSDRVFRASDGDIGVYLDDLGDELETQGHQDVTRSRGNYKITLVVSGVRINIVDSNDEYRATTYSVNSGTETITGSGFQGYVTVNE